MTHELRRAAQNLADDLHLSGDELAQKIMKRCYYQWLFYLHAYNLRVLLKLSKNLISQWVGDLSVYAGVPDIPMSQVIGHILDTSSSFE